MLLCLAGWVGAKRHRGAHGEPGAAAGSGLGAQFCATEHSMLRYAAFSSKPDHGVFRVRARTWDAGPRVSRPDWTRSDGAALQRRVGLTCVSSAPEVKRRAAQIMVGMAAAAGGSPGPGG